MDHIEAFPLDKLVYAQRRKRCPEFGIRLEGERAEPVHGHAVVIFFPGGGRKYFNLVPFFD